jgi:hypothetical protein
VARRVRRRRPQGTALDQLEFEDRALLEVIDDFQYGDEPRRHGMAGKLLVEHLAVREAAREQVAAVLQSEPACRELGGSLAGDVPAHRKALAKLDELARGVQPVNLNRGQDFDAFAVPVARLMREEILHELQRTIPAIRATCPAKVLERRLPRARWVRSHAPTHPHPDGRRRYERFAPLVRIHALYDWLRGFPTGGTRPSKEFGLPPNPDRPY